jgi:acyl carrier protein
MTNETPTITVDCLIDMLKQVIEENPSQHRGTVSTTDWGPDTLLDETGFSSYDLVEIIFKIEDRFNVEIDYNANNSINDVKTIGGLRDEIAKLLAQERA